MFGHRSKRDRILTAQRRAGNPARRGYTGLTSIRDIVAISASGVAIFLYGTSDLFFTTRTRRTGDRDSSPAYIAFFSTL